MSMKKMLAVVAAASLVAVAAPAFAANPFSDVPMNHWAYDAVEQMAAKGILEGYPNGTFKGNRAMTRYEIAQMVARMMANGVGGADADKLKALIVEFAPELEALGVKVDGFDGRLSKLEKGVGGVKIWGQLRIDNRWRTNDTGSESYMTDALNRYRIFLSKQVDEKTTVTTRIGGSDAKFQLYWLDTKDFLFNNMTLSAGKFNFDWEADDGMYKAADAIVGDPDGAFTGFRLAYKVGGVDVTALAGSTEYGHVKADTYGARLAFGSSRFKLSLNWLHYDHDSFASYWAEDPKTEKWTKYASVDSKLGKFSSYNHYWANLGISLVDGLAIKGAYHMEKYKNDDPLFTDDDPKAWRVILDVNQKVLKFTSLWFEYGKYDKNFLFEHAAAYNTLGTGFGIFGKAGGLFDDEVYVAPADMKIMYAKLEQKWNSKWSTYETFHQAKTDDNVAIKNNADKVTLWSVGIKYQYSPALSFDLTYNDRKWHGMSGYEDTKDRGIRLRTLLNF